MNRQQVNHFTQAGYLRVPGRLDEAIVAELTSVVETVFAEAQEPYRVNATGDIFRVDGLLDRHPVFLQALGSAAILEPLVALLGPDIEVLRYRHNHATRNRAGDTPYRLHRDIQQWSRPLVNVFIYLDDSTVENGCTHVVPCSQALPYEGCQSGEGGGNWADEHDGYQHIMGQELPIPMPRGGVLLLNALAFHTVGRNVTTGPRRSIVFACHSTDDLRKGTNESSVLLAGRRFFRGNQRTPLLARPITD
jgi:ectoine hydroxylase-related dioxygenase (phytanoyl-CoA dioxygenase family)